jgi:hypothetical protein
MDYAGPLYLERGKAFVLLFSCAVTRSLHVELVEDMSTELLLLAFRRFVSMRSACRTIICDNAKTFKKAAELLEGKKKTITFRFIPERSPWWGGFYERMVGSIKSALRKILGRSSLSFRELETVLKEIACALNHRPLTVNMGDPDDERPLTPAHFLDGSPPNTLLNQPDETDFTKEPFLIPTLQHKQRLLQRTWKRWRTEYLQGLHRWRTKLGSSETHLFAPRIGDVVLVEDEVRKNRHLWPLAKVVKLIAGKDGVIRTVVVRRSDGVELRRATRRIFLLEAAVPQTLPSLTTPSSRPSDRPCSVPSSSQHHPKTLPKAPVPIRTRAGRVVKGPDRLKLV